MKMSEEFPSKHLKAADLNGREVKVIMQNVERETIGNDTRPVLYLKGKDKGVVLNKTNAKVISDAYGDDTEDWYDQPVILFSAMVDFQGKIGPAIRCRVPTAKDNRDTAPRRATGGISDNQQELRDSISSGPPPGHPAAAGAPMDDDIPF